MCGIYGTTRMYSQDQICKKLDLIRFRGPDAQGVARYNLHNGQLTIGHVRLSIIDLDARANQPFEYSPHTAIVFNGEIYNYAELKTQCLADCSFRTNGDTEVLCAMYEKYGAGMLKYLNGMFAFVIYDKKKNVLFGARDRLGKKPFYYWFDEGEFEFASQPSSIVFGNKFEIDDRARTYYFFGNYIPDPYCIYKGIKKLRAGQFFTYRLDGHDLRIENYWDIYYNSCQFEIPKCFEEAKDTLKYLLEDSVRMRLKADVPVGIYLSGGIDSSLVAALVAKENKQVTSYCIGYNDTKFDESGYAKAVAEHVGIPFKCFQCEGRDLLAMMKDYTRYFDEPFGDDSLIPSSLVAKKASESVKVVLGGDGGDELFHGYPRYQQFATLDRLYRIPFPIRFASSHLLHKITKRNATRALRYRDVNDAILATSTVHDYYGAEEYNPLVVAKTLPDIEYLRKERGLLMYSDFDMKHYLNSNGNTKTDRANMRFSLELRSPIMDYRIAEYSRLLPYEYLYDKDLGGKSILRSILYDMVPREIMERPKMGFSTPVERWLKTDLRDVFHDTVSYESVKNEIPELNVMRILKLRDDFLSGDSRKFYIMWVIFNYLNWSKHACNL